MSVIITTQDDKELLARSVLSADRAGASEIIVVDRASREQEQLELLEHFKGEGVVVISSRHPESETASRMSAVALSENPYLVLLTAGDTLLPGSLHSLHNAIAANPKAAIAYGDYKIVGDWSGMWRAREAGLWELTYRNPYPRSSLVRVRALKEVGGWDLEEGYCDWDLWLKLHAAGWESVVVDGVIYERRLVGSAKKLARNRQTHQERYLYLKKMNPTLFEARHIHKKDTPIVTRWTCLLLEGEKPRFSWKVRYLVWKRKHSLKRLS